MPVSPVKDQPWGMHEFTLTGPSGSNIRIGCNTSGQGYAMGADARQSFVAVVLAGPKRRVSIPLPFVPDETWGAKTDHHVAGTINSMAVRAVAESLGGFGIVVGPTWRRDCGTDVGDEVSAVLAPEGPQRDDLGDEFRIALES